MSGEPQGMTKPREIIVKFRSHGGQLQLLKGRAYLREKKLNIYVNEDLSKARKSLSHACRKLKKDTNSNIVNTWVYNSSIGVTLAPMTSGCQIQDGGPHGVIVAPSKMTAPTASDPRWRPPRSQIQDGGPCDAFGNTSEGEFTP